MGAGGYWSDEAGAAKQAERRDLQYREKLQRFVAPHLLPTEKLSVVAEAISGAHPFFLTFDSQAAFYTKMYIVAATDSRLILIRGSEFLPHSFRRRGDDKAAQLSSVKCVFSKSLGYIRLALWWPNGDHFVLNFEPGWKREALEIMRLLRTF